MHRRPIEPMKRVFPVFIIFLLTAVCARAEWMIHTELQVVILPKKDAAALMPELRDDAKIDAAFTKVEQLVKTGEARLEAKLIGKGASGTKLEAKQVEEVRYATEWDQPEPIGGGKVPAVAVQPTSFEVREVGLLFSAESTASEDGRVLRMKVEHSHVRMLGWTEFEAARLPDNSTVTIKQPRFSVERGGAEIAMASGSRTLLGIHAVPEKPNKLELFILRAWTTPTAK